MEQKIYLCIDLKSFYASVECVERGLDPLTANLVVADPSRGRGGICLAITPAMKALGIRNRCRIFEIPDSVEYITAIPRMKLYMEYSARIYSIYLKYVAAEDIHVYSIDECFFDVTHYLSLYRKTARQMAQMLLAAVLEETGISATVGIGTNLFLAKVALDVTAKHAPDRIGILDEELFREQIWHHRPITDIWNVGRGIAKRLEKYGVYDLYGVAHMEEETLYREFGVNAEFLIDHSKGIEPCTIREIKEYVPSTTSVSNGQILFEDYDYDDALLAMKEMVDLLVPEIVDKGLVTDSITLHIGYSDNAAKSTGGTKKIPAFTNSEKKLMQYFVDYYKSTTRRGYPIRRLNIGLNNLISEDFVNLSFLPEYMENEKERNKQKAIMAIKRKYGKNAIIKGMNLEEKATARTRNKLIGGHNGE